MAMNEKDIEDLKRAFSKRPNYKTSTGYTGNQKTVKQRKEQKKKKKTYSKKQRQLEDLTREQYKIYWKLQNQIEEMFQKHSNVTKREEGKKTKKDVKTGLKADGIWSISTFKNYLKHSKTFIKYCVKEHGIKKLGDLKPGMMADYVRKNVDEGKSAKTISSYYSAVKKMGELGGKEGILRMKKLGSKSVQEMIPEYRQEDYRRGKLNGYTTKDVQVIAKKAGEHFSPLHKAAVEVLGMSGLRLDEFLGTKWSHLDFENNRIYLTDPGMTKGSRPRFAEVPEKTMNLLKEIKDLNLHSNDNERIWGSRMTEDDVRGFVKESARIGKRKYSGIHDFRRSTISFAIKNLEKEFKKGTMNKAKLVDKIMQHVNADPKLNPIIKQYPPKLGPDGKPIWEERKNGSKFMLRDKSKPPIEKRKYIREELMGKRIDFLKNTYLSEKLGHNRSDITAVYKEKDFSKTKEKRK